MSHKHGRCQSDGGNCFNWCSLFPGTSSWLMLAISHIERHYGLVYFKWWNRTRTGLAWGTSKFFLIPKVPCIIPCPIRKELGWSFLSSLAHQWFPTSCPQANGSKVFMTKLLETILIKWVNIRSEMHLIQHFPLRESFEFYYLSLSHSGPWRTCEVLTA